MTFHLTRSSDTIPSRLSYDSAAHAARLTAPLIPATRYDVSVTAGVADSGGTPLGADTLWSFTTHVPQTVVVDTGPNPAYTSLAIGTGSVMHLTYEVGNRILKYARCQSACTSPGAWARMVIDSTWAVGRFNALAVDRQGSLHVSYALEPGAGAALEYALCGVHCSSVADWLHVVVDSGRSPSWTTSLATNDAGGIAVAFPQRDSLRVALCATGCLSGANWHIVPIAPNVIASALIAEGNGRLHLVYYDNRLWYATCSSACTDVASWTRVLADSLYGAGNNPSVVLDRTGRLHVSYFDFGRQDLRYATCAMACTSASSWTALTVDTAGVQGYFSALMVDDADRVRIVHGDELRYSACVATCTQPANWRTGILAGDQGGYLSAKLDQQGQFHVSYLDYGSGYIKYLR